MASRGSPAFSQSPLVLSLACTLLIKDLLTSSSFCPIHYLLLYLYFFLNSCKSCLAQNSALTPSCPLHETQSSMQDFPRCWPSASLEHSAKASSFL